MTHRPADTANASDQVGLGIVAEDDSLIDQPAVPGQPLRPSFQQLLSSSQSAPPLRDFGFCPATNLQPSIQDRRKAPKRLTIHDPDTLIRYAEELPVPLGLLHGDLSRKLQATSPNRHPRKEVADGSNGERIRRVPGRKAHITTPHRVVSHHAATDVDEVYLEQRRKKGRGVVIVSPEEGWQEVGLSPVALGTVRQRSPSKAEQQPERNEARKNTRSCRWNACPTVLVLVVLVLAVVLGVVVTVVAS